MMPFIMDPISKYLWVNESGVPEINRAIGQAIHESVSTLVTNMEPNESVLIGEIKVTSDLISYEKFRKIFLDTLLTESNWKILDREDRRLGTSEVLKQNILDSREVVIVLNIQFYDAGNRIWLAQQVLDMRTNQIIWSGIYDWPLQISTRNKGIDTSRKGLHIETF